MNALLQDLRYGLRMLAKSPVVSAVAALSLALGIAATSSILAVLNGFLLEPLPYEDQSTLALLREGPVGEPIEMFGGTSMGSFHAYREGAPSIRDVATYSIEVANLTGTDAPEQVNVIRSTPNLMDVLGRQPTLGRGFQAEEGTEGRGQVVVLEHDFWMERFQGDPGILGETVLLDGAAYSVIGVMPEDFDLIPAFADVFLPSDFADERDDFASRRFLTWARLAPGATAERLQLEMEAQWAAFALLHPEVTRGLEPRALPARDFFPGRTDTLLLTVLSAVTLFGLLIACANVANLLLARAEERRKEVAVRTALGAGGGRILRQLLTESVTLGAVAGAIGIPMAAALIRAFQGTMPPVMPDAMIPRLSPEVLAASVAISMLAGVAFGVGPALYASRGALSEAMNGETRGGTGSRSRTRLRNVFVIGEFAVALALLTGAAFLGQAFTELVETDPGYRQDGLLTFGIQAQEARFPGSDELRIYHQELLASLEAVPGSQGVAAMLELPRGQQGTPSIGYDVEGRDRPDNVDRPRADYQAVNAGYFTTLEIPLVQGRFVEEGDRADSPPVAVVSEAFVAREFPGVEALGQRVVLQGEEEPRSIVGVVANTVQQRITLAGQGGEAVYVPLAQRPPRALSFAVRFSGDPNTRAEALRQAVWQVNPDQPLDQLQTLDAHVSASLAAPRAMSYFVGAMGVIALALASMGIYGVLAHSVTQRRREIGIRMALGAAQGTVLAMITRNGLRLVLTGMLLGLPLACGMYWAVSNALGLFQTGMAASWAVGVSGLLVLVAFVATLLPARRASAVRPMTALRDG